MALNTESFGNTKYMQVEIIESTKYITVIHLDKGKRKRGKEQEGN